MKIVDAMVGLRYTRWLPEEKAALYSQPTVALALQNYRKLFPQSTRTEYQIRSAWGDRKRYNVVEYLRALEEVKA